MDATEAFKLFMEEESDSNDDEDSSSDEEPALRSSMLWADKNLVSFNP